MNTQAISISRIDVGKNRRALSRPAVKALAASMAEVGLLNPISVFQVGDAFELVAGAHRVAAAKSLGWTEIDAVLTDLQGIDRAIAEIDENLTRHNLSAAELAQQTVRRKELYLKKHPETAKGGDRKSPSARSNQSADSAFSSDTAEKTGRSRRSVEVDTQIGENIPADIFEAITDTPLAHLKTDLLALARLTPDAQREIVTSTDLNDKAAVREAINGYTPPRPKPEQFTLRLTVEAITALVIERFTVEQKREILAILGRDMREINARAQAAAV